MLVGTGDLEDLAQGAARLMDFGTEPQKLLGVESLQIAWELERGAPDGLLPPGLHPTRPPVLTWLVQRVLDSAWGPFAMAQCRIECRSGLRPRGFLRGGVVDTTQARGALAKGWGFALQTGDVHLSRGYDEIRASVVLGSRGILAVSLRDPTPLQATDAYYVANMNLAHTPNGLRLVQVDPAVEVERAERGRPIVELFDADAWGCPGVRLSDPISASFTVASVTLPALRFVCRPDILAFEGTERVDT